MDNRSRGGYRNNNFRSNQPDRYLRDNRNNYRPNRPPSYGNNNNNGRFQRNTYNNNNGYNINRNGYNRSGNNNYGNSSNRGNRAVRVIHDNQGKATGPMQIRLGEASNIEYSR